MAGMETIADEGESPQLDWGEISSRVHARARALSSRCRLSSCSAADLAQEALLRLCNCLSADELRSASRLHTWVETTLQRLFIDELRRARWRRVKPQRVPLEAASPPRPAPSAPLQEAIDPESPLVVLLRVEDRRSLEGLPALLPQPYRIIAQAMLDHGGSSRAARSVLLAAIPTDGRSVSDSAFKKLLKKTRCMLREVQLGCDPRIRFRGSFSTSKNHWIGTLRGPLHVFLAAGSQALRSTSDARGSECSPDGDSRSDPVSE